MHVVAQPLLFSVLLLFLLVLPATVSADDRHGNVCAEASFHWTKIPAMNDGPKNFSQSGNAAIGTHIYVFGGNFQFGQTFYNDFYAFDTVHNRWSPLKSGPSPRAFPSVASIDEHTDGGFFLLYGGTNTFRFDSQYKALDDFWLYSVQTDMWEKMDSQPNPGPRTGATLFVDGTKVYLFGGFVDVSTEPPNDVWEFDMHTKQWKQLFANNTQQGPLGRNIATGGPDIVKDEDGHKKLLIYGGEGFNLASFQFPILDDLWEFDLTTLSWTEIATTASNVDVDTSEATPKRNYAGNVFAGDFLYLFGGDVASAADGPPEGICGGVFPENPINEIWRYHTELHKWEQISIGDSSDPFVGVKDQGRAVVVDVENKTRKIYLVGGYTCVPGATGRGERAYINDVYMLEERCNDKDLEQQQKKKDDATSSEL